MKQVSGRQKADRAVNTLIEELQELDFDRMARKVRRRIREPTQAGVTLDSYVKHQLSTPMTRERVGKYWRYDITPPDWDKDVFQMLDPASGSWKIYNLKREKRIVTYGGEAPCPADNEECFGPKQLVCGRRGDPARTVRNTYPRGRVSLVLFEDTPGRRKRDEDHKPRRDVTATELFWRNSMFAQLSESLWQRQDSLGYPMQFRTFVNWGLESGGTLRHLHSQCQLIFTPKRFEKVREQQEFGSTIAVMREFLHASNQLLAKGMKPHFSDIMYFPPESQGRGNILLLPHLREVFDEYTKLMEPFHWTGEERDDLGRRLRQIGYDQTSVGSDLRDAYDTAIY